MQKCTQKFDLLVVGSGPAGQRAAVQAAKLGRKVGIITRDAEMGGVSVHTGTIPSKTMREAVLYLSGWRQRGFYGHSYRVKENISANDVIQRIEMTLNKQVEVLRHQLVRNGITIINGMGEFLNPQQLLVTGPDNTTGVYESDYILLAVGTQPYRPEHIPFNSKTVVDSDNLLSLEDLPRSMAVIGGGVIGLEYATIFSALDIEVTLIEGRASILDFVDREIVDEFQHHLRDRGVSLRMEEHVTDITHAENGRVIISLQSGKKISTELVLYAAGRVGSTGSLNLAKAELMADNRGRLTVNKDFQTAVPHIYAAGDIIGFPSLAATSMEQGRLAACHMFNQSCHSHPEFFPYGIYSVPEISLVGKTEKQLKEENIPYESGIARIRETARGQILGLREGILKMFFSIEDQRLLGVHIVGEGATEMIHIGQAVMTLGGTLDYFVESAFNYPTLAEAYKVAALNAWNKMSAYQTGNTSQNSQKSVQIPLTAIK